MDLLSLDTLNIQIIEITYLNMKIQIFDILNFQETEFKIWKLRIIKSLNHKYGFVNFKHTEYLNMKITFFLKIHQDFLDTEFLKIENICIKNSESKIWIW